MNLSFRDLVRSDEPVAWAFEFVTPFLSAPEQEGLDKVEHFFETLGGGINTLDAIIMPDIDPEETGHEHVAPRDFAENGLRRWMDAKSPGTDIVVYQRSVKMPWGGQRDWLLETHGMGYHNVVVAGGRSHTVEYPGLPVAEFIEEMKELYIFKGTDFSIGVNLFPGRRGEAQRMMTKHLAGADYFVTQILHDTGRLEEVLVEYNRLCGEWGEEKKRVIVEITPIGSKWSYNFMKNDLKVDIPDEVAKKVFSDKEGAGRRSVEHLAGMVKGFFDRMSGTGLRLGVYTGCVLDKHLSFSADLSEGLYDKLHTYNL